jgi:hypothetical protein
LENEVDIMAIYTLTSSITVVGKMALDIMALDIMTPNMMTLDIMK